MVIVETLNSPVPERAHIRAHASSPFYSSQPVRCTGMLPLLSNEFVVPLLLFLQPVLYCWQAFEEQFNAKPRIVVVDPFHAAIGPKA